MPEKRIPPRYRVIEEVGQGGMAVVLRAYDETLGREVAIKLLHPHLSAEPESKARLQREAQAVAKLHHENIVEIFDYSGVDSEASYIVTEYIDGKNLKQFMAERGLAWPDVAAVIAAEVCGALAHAHSVGIIHRDVKPENVMIRKDGVLKLMDFGIAQVLDLQRMTVTGQLLGSPAYMAPELIDGKQLDVRTDVFSVGIMLYQLATGELPFSGKNPGEVLRRIAEGKFIDPRVRQKRVSDDLRRIISRALAHEPDDRYPDVARLLVDLRAHLGDCGITDTRSELRAYFADPEPYEKSFPTRIATALAENGRRAMGEHKTSRALELWNRALILDPQNAGVLAGLRRIEGRRRLLTAAAVTVGLVMAVGAFLGVAQAFKPEPDVARILAAREPPAPVATAAPTPSPPTAAATPVFDSPGLGKPAIPRKPKTRTVAASGVKEGPGIELVLAPTPQNVDVFLDGERQFTWEAGRTLPVKLDKPHVIELRNDNCCNPAQIKIGPDNRLLEDKWVVRLRKKPASLLITTDPPDPEAKLSASYKKAGKDTTVAVTPGRVLQIYFAESEVDLTKDVVVTALYNNETRQVTFPVRAGQPPPDKPYSFGLPVGRPKP